MDNADLFDNILVSIKNLNTLNSAIYHQGFLANLNKDKSADTIKSAQELLEIFLKGLCSTSDSTTPTQSPHSQSSEPLHPR